MKNRQTLLGLFLLAGGLSAALASAHVGPPFPIVEDRKVGPYLASIWTDPDIGTATFFVILEAPEGAPFAPPAKVELAVQPVSGRLSEAVYRAEPQAVRVGARYYTPAELDRGEMWKVRVRIDGPAGGGEIKTQVEATPAGSIGPIGLVLYPLPFLALGFLWWRAAAKRRQWIREHGAEAAVHPAP